MTLFHSKLALANVAAALSGGGEGPQSLSQVDAVAPQLRRLLRRSEDDGEDRPVTSPTSSLPKPGSQAIRTRIVNYESKLIALNDFGQSSPSR